MQVDENKRKEDQELEGSKINIKMAAARVNAGLTQAEFAAIVGFRTETVNNWENGKSEPPVSVLRKLSELSGIPMDFIFVPYEFKKTEQAEG